MSCFYRRLLANLCTLFLGFISSTQVSALDLIDAITEAEKNDQTLAAAVANRDAATENIAINRSRLLPQVNAQGTYARANQGVEQLNVLGQTSRRDYQVNSKNSQVNIRQGLLRPRDWLGLDVGQLQAEYGFQKLLSAQSDLWLRTVSLWVDVLAAKENRRAQAEAVDSSGHAAQQAKKRRRAGDGTRDAEAEAVAQHELAKAQLVEAEETLKAREIAFRLLTGKDGRFQHIKLPHYSRLRFNLSNNSQSIERILNSNPELMTAKLAEEVSQKRLMQAKSDHYPTVDLFASRSVADSDTVNTLGTKYSTSQVGVQIMIPLYSGGGLSATERQSASTLMAAKADRMAAEQRLSTQFNADWASQKFLLERARAADALVKAAREQRRGAELGLKGGLRSWSDVAVADLLVARREADYINYTASLIKTQAKVLSVLPISDDDWSAWVRYTAAIAKN